MTGDRESSRRMARGSDPPRGRARFALARRDLLEFVRDRRTLVVTLLLPMAMYPILALSSALGVRTAISDIDARNAPTTLAIMLTGDRRDAHALAQRVESLFAPVAEAAVTRRGWPASVSFAHGSAEEARRIVEVGDAVLWLEVPEGVLERLEESETIALVAHGPETRPISDRERDQFTAVMQGLAEDARRRRIDRAGLPETLLEPLRLRFTGTADGPKAVSSREILPTVAGGVFVLLAVLTLTGAFYPAIDAIAGEKERGTIETLLIAPCAPIDIVTGKFLAVWAVAVAALVANVISIGLTTAVSLRFVPAGGPLLPGVHLAVVAGASLVVFLGLSALAAAMCLAVTTASRSQKEAQNTLTPVLLFASALAGAGLLAELRGNPWLAVVPFGGQVAVARATLEPDVSPAVGAAHDAGGLQRIAVATALSLGSSIVLVWLMLQGTAWMLTDEEILFRGPDVAGSPFTRPARRRRPTVAQGIVAIVIGLAAIWYGQGLVPADLVWAIPVQQATAVGLPLAILLAWQRVDLRRSFAIAWPGAGREGLAIRGPLATVGAAALGAGLFVLGVALLLAIRGPALSAEAQKLSARLLAVIRDRPVWLSWTLIALVPAVCEEFLFRGWVQSALIGEWPTRGRAVAAVVLQAAAFAILHLLPERMPQTFALGLVTGALVLATRSLLPAIVCHAAHNSMPLVLMWLAGGMAGATEGAVPPHATLPGWAVGAAVVAAALGSGLVWLAVDPRIRLGRTGAASPVAAVVAAVGLLAAGNPLGAGESAAGDGAAGPEKPLRVAVMPIASVVEWKGDGPTGVAIDVWNELSLRTGLEGTFVRIDSFPQLMESVSNGVADIALGPIAITEERERIMDLTHSVAHSGLRIAVRPRGRSGFFPALESLLSWHLLQFVGGVLVLALASGHLLWWFERRVNPESFPEEYVRGVWEAVWWIASTIVVGGCDNKHVVSVLGRAIAFAWMVGGIVLLAAFTSVLTATMTAEQVTAGSIQGPKELAGRVVGCQESSVCAKAARQRGAIVREFPFMDEAITALAAGTVDAVVGEHQQLLFLANQPGAEPLRLVGPMFEAFDYGIGLPSGSPLRERLNAAILRMREDGSLERIRERWFGRHD